jgi:NAD(P)-dependent dehydrogenase (short-subunit alcohol dehydrogenase family)
MKKIAVITGASSGIGFSIASKFVQRGFYVIGIARRNCVACDESYQLDISNVWDYINILKKIIEKHERIDILINNAGIFPIEADMSLLSEYEKIMKVNLDPVYFSTEYLCRTQDYCQIINMASLSGVMADSDCIPYSISKAGVITLTKAFARKYTNHRINSISPGFVHTPLVSKNDEPLPDFLLKTIPLKREAKPHEIADIVNMIIDADYMTGSNIIIDGGVSLGAAPN